MLLSEDDPPELLPDDGELEPPEEPGPPESSPEELPPPLSELPPVEVPEEGDVSNEWLSIGLSLSVPPLHPQSACTVAAHVTRTIRRTRSLAGTPCCIHFHRPGTRKSLRDGQNVTRMTSSMNTSAILHNSGREQWNRDNDGMTRELSPIYVDLRPPVLPGRTTRPVVLHPPEPSGHNQKPPLSRPNPRGVVHSSR